MNELFIKFILTKLKSRRTLLVVKAHMEKSGESFDDIVINTLMERGESIENARIILTDFKDEFSSITKSNILLYLKFVSQKINIEN
ncbi:MAG: hypothetical protein IPF62_10950 [Bacteroidetes bacterium]|nr:hypothetical protein [Bacteroidota bacterium]